QAQSAGDPAGATSDRPGVEKSRTGVTRFAGSSRRPDVGEILANASKLPLRDEKPYSPATASARRKSELIFPRARNPLQPLSRIFTGQRRHFFTRFRFLC